MTKADHAERKAKIGPWRIRRENAGYTVYRWNGTINRTEVHRNAMLQPHQFVADWQAQGEADRLNAVMPGFEHIRVDDTLVNTRSNETFHVDAIRQHKIIASNNLWGNQIAITGQQLTDGEYQKAQTTP